LHEISQQEKISIQAVLEKAIEKYRRQYVLAQTNRAYTKLRKNPKAWEEEMNERTSWENTLSDDLGTCMK
jgi:phage tail tape-measure protein